MTLDHISSTEDIKREGRLLPFSKLREILETTEPVEQRDIYLDGTNDISMEMPKEWNLFVQDLDDSALTSCYINIAGSRYQLTKKAVTTIVGHVGLSDRFILNTPGDLVEPLATFWLNNQVPQGRKEPKVNLITRGDFAVGMTPSYLPLVSNLLVLDEVEKFLRARSSVKEIMVDPNIVNNYMLTDFRLVMVDDGFKVHTTRNGELEEDTWHYGIHITNALVTRATRPLNISGYILEEENLAGVIPEFSSLVGFSRQGILDVDDLKGWIRSTLSQIFDVLPAEAKLIQDMPELSLHGKVGALTTDLFETMKIHRRAREMATDILTNTGDMSSYGLMVALANTTSPRSHLKMSPRVVQNIQKIAGALPTRAKQMCGSCGRLHLMGV